jgi:alkanesulfonate monooxygenase SsuD/methylene tetrahydromethanopterin reductase-like flavin-dependent oxidoreductase (luciferase family)
MGHFFGRNSFKFGVFGLNCAGGMTLSTAPERWQAHWDEITDVAVLADRSGIEFLLPIAKWHGLGGAADMWGRSFETFTQAAALAAITEKIGLFVTAHVSLLTPPFVAKAITTIDHISHGRAGLNIVCGWNPEEFNMHGISVNPDTRYAKGLEWYHIFEKLMNGEHFDWLGKHYQLTGLLTNPLPLQKPFPPVMSAAQSGDGQIFAAQAADILFTAMHSIQQVQDSLAQQKKLSLKYHRQQDVYVETQIICKPTRKQAEEWLYYYAVEHADFEALNYFKKQKATTLSKSTREAHSSADKAVLKSVQTAANKYPGIFPGMFPLCGSPDDLVEEFKKLHDIGVSGSALVFLNYAQEMPYFVEEVLPRMERAGLRYAHRPER